MESQTLEERLNFEAQRVATAFGVLLQKAQDQEGFESWAFFHGTFEDATLEWAIERWSAQLIFVSLGRWIDDDYEGCGVEFSEGRHCKWGSSPQYDGKYNLNLACGLYRLGIDTKALIHHLQVYLTNHEKVELRLSMPREFWPKMWLEEEGNPDKGTKRSST